MRFENIEHLHSVEIMLHLRCKCLIYYLRIVMLEFSDFIDINSYAKKIITPSQCKNTNPK